MIVKRLTEHHLEFVSLKGGCTGLSETTHVKMQHCWKSHALAQILEYFLFYIFIHVHLSYDVASGSKITPCNKIDRPLVVYRFTGNVMTSITTLRS